MQISLTLSLLVFLLALQGAHGQSPNITEVIVGNLNDITIVVSNMPTQTTRFNVYVFLKKEVGDDVSITNKSVSFRRGRGRLYPVYLEPFIVHSVKIHQWFSGFGRESPDGSNAFEFTSNAKLTVKSVESTSITVGVPERHSNDIIKQYKFLYTTEKYEEFNDTGSRLIQYRTSPPVRLSGLEEGAKYLIQVEPITTYFFCVKPGHVTVTTLSTEPDAAPRNLTYTSSSNSIQLHWAPPPARNRNGQITHYRIKWRKDFVDGTDQTQSLNVSGSPSNVTFSYLITGLDSGSRYQIQVAAVNGAGDGTFGRVLASTNYTEHFVRIQDDQRSGKDGDTKAHAWISKMMKLCYRLNQLKINCLFTYQLPLRKNSINYFGNEDLFQRMHNRRF